MIFYMSSSRMDIYPSVDQYFARKEIYIQNLYFLSLHDEPVSDVLLISIRVRDTGMRPSSVCVICVRHMPFSHTAKLKLAKP